MPIPSSKDLQQEMLDYIQDHINDAELRIRFYTSKGGYNNQYYEAAVQEELVKSYKDLLNNQLALETLTRKFNGVE